MAFEIVNSLDILSMTLEMIGKEGPWIVDIGMAEHNDVDRTLAKKGKIVVGEKGKTITVDDVKKCVNTMKKEMRRKEYDNGRSYYFEGVSTHNKRSTFSWGS